LHDFSDIAALQALVSLDCVQCLYSNAFDERVWRFIGSQARCRGYKA
jgi:hypothetical protein